MKTGAGNLRNVLKNYRVVMSGFKEFIRWLKPDRDKNYNDKNIVL